MRKTKTQSPIKLRDSIQKHVHGRFSLMLGDREGNPLWDAPLTVDNAVVTSGRAWLLRHIMSASSSYPGLQAQIIQAIAIGGSGTPPTTSDILLGSEISRTSITTEQDNSALAGAPNVVWAASWSTAAGNGVIAECGIFNTMGANAQTMLAHAIFTATFTKTASNTLTVSYTLSA